MFHASAELMGKLKHERESSTARGYGWKWRKARAIYLQEHPLCSMCQGAGKIVAASVVDHIKPHKGDYSLMWDTSNWQSLCKTHHDSAKQSQDKTGIERGCDAKGNPLDEKHFWRSW